MTHFGECRILLHFSLVIMCPNLVDPANGMVSVTGNLPGDTATYTCDSGYTLEGESPRVCGNDGEWSGMAPTCICKKPHNHTHKTNNGHFSLKIFTCHCYIAELRTVETSLETHVLLVNIICNVTGTDTWIKFLI